MAEALLIAIVGAESTGKTTLAQALTRRLAAESGLRCTWVDEWLRCWCEREQRVPRADEQRGIAEEAARRIDHAAASHEVVVCDTTPLMIATYSRWIFNDHTLDAWAAAWHRRCALTLLTAIDLPWVADGLQREGPHVREPVDGHLRDLLCSHGLPFAVIGGLGDARVQQAVDSIAPLVLQRLQGGRAGRNGLFSRQAPHHAGRGRDRWRCECCGDLACKQAVPVAQSPQSTS